jgi:hypothetical protein
MPREVTPCNRRGPAEPPACPLVPARPTTNRRMTMGKGILMWLIGIPIPIIILLLIFWH